ncbi:3909_t:CDS:1, partial [Gigaspora margarita]
ILVALLNVTFGNAVELIISIIALMKGQIRVAKETLELNKVLIRMIYPNLKCLRIFFGKSEIKKIQDLFETVSNNFKNSLSFYVHDSFSYYPLIIENETMYYVKNGSEILLK